MLQFFRGQVLHNDFPDFYLSLRHYDAAYRITYQTSAYGIVENSSKLPTSKILGKIKIKYCVRINVSHKVSSEVQFSFVSTISYENK